MKLIVGLGNPDREYENTRHNTGFLVLDKVAKELKCELTMNKFQALIALIKVDEEKVMLMKPLTYMNNSGVAVKMACDFYKIEPKDILVIYDDMDLEVGSIRLRSKGSCGGHNGIKSIINLLNTQEIKRVRVGIGDRGRIEGPDYVLGKFSKEEKAKIDGATTQASLAAIQFLHKPFEQVMNQFNRKSDE